MNTQDLILRIAECLSLVTATHIKQGDEPAELLLRRLQLLWLKERPLKLHTLN